MTTGNAAIDRVVESLCGDGCVAVRDYIQALQSDQVLPQWAHLTAAERADLRHELESIMAVYGDACRL